MIHPVSSIICYVFIVVHYADKHSEEGGQAHEYGNYTEADINQFLIHLYLDVSKMNNEYLEIILDEIGKYTEYSVEILISRIFFCFANFSLDLHTSDTFSQTTFH